jgi:hypothetical protein
MRAPPTRQPTAAPAMLPELETGPGVADIEEPCTKTVVVVVDNEADDEDVAEVIF